MSSALPNPSTAWRAVQQRDRSFDGRFVYAVSSTRIFCRPSCSSRRPSRARVEFFSSPSDAERAGFRACKRCRPASAEPAAIDRAVARASSYLTQHADEPVTLARLAREVGMSAFHLQRVFKRALGVSPREFRDAERQRLLASRLRQGDTVSRATYEAGFGSSSRVYERSLGMTPATLRKGGVGQRSQYSIVDCPLGRLLVPYTERGSCAASRECPTRRSHSMRKGLRSSGACGRRCSGSREAPRSRTALWPEKSASRPRCAPSRALARPIPWRWSFRVIAWYARMAGWGATGGGSSGRRPCSIVKDRASDSPLVAVLEHSNQACSRAVYLTSQLKLMSFFRSLFLALALAPSMAAAQESADLFTWSGRLAAGATLGIK